MSEALEVIRAERGRLQECLAAFVIVEQHLTMLNGHAGPEVLVKQPEALAAAIPEDDEEDDEDDEPATPRESRREKHAKGTVDKVVLDFMAGSHSWLTQNEISEHTGVHCASIGRVLRDNSRLFESKKSPIPTGFRRPMVYCHRDNVPPEDEPVTEPVKPKPAPVDQQVLQLAKAMNRIGAAQSYQIASKAGMDLTLVNRLLAGSKWFTCSEGGRWMLTEAGRVGCGG